MYPLSKRISIRAVSLSLHCIIVYPVLSSILMGIFPFVPYPRIFILFFNKIFDQEAIFVTIILIYGLYVISIHHKGAPCLWGTKEV